MNSIQMKEPEFQSSKFVDSIVDGSPANKVTTVFKQNDSEMIFRGDSFQREDFEPVQRINPGTNVIQNMVLHLTGTCPTCKQPLPPDFNQYLVMNAESLLNNN